MGWNCEPWVRDRRVDSSSNHSLPACKSGGEMAAPEGLLGLPTEVLVSFQTLLMVRQVHCETRHYPVILFIHTLYPFFTTQGPLHGTWGEHRNPLSAVSLRERTVPECLSLEASVCHQKANWVPPCASLPESPIFLSHCIHMLSVPQDRAGSPPATTRRKTATSCNLIYFYLLAN